MKRRSRGSKVKPVATENAARSDAGAVAGHALRRKIDLLEARLKPLEPFASFSVSRFVENLPGFARLMPLLAQSTVDVCHSLARRFTAHKPRSTYDIFDLCAQYSILSDDVLRPLLRQIVLIEDGLDLEDGDEVLRLHRELPETVRVFRELLEECREYSAGHAP